MEQMKEELVAVIGRCFDIDKARFSSTSSARKAG
jgi:septum formation topological specificity factor MinE